MNGRRKITSLYAALSLMLGLAAWIAPSVAAQAEVEDARLEVYLNDCEGTFNEAAHIREGDCTTNSSLNDEASVLIKDGATSRTIEGSDLKWDQVLGAYIFEGLPDGTYLEFIGFDSPNHNQTAVEGSDGWTTGGNPYLYVESGNNHLTFFHYNDTDGGSEPDSGSPATEGTADILVRLHVCPDGVNPRDVEPEQVCTEPVWADASATMYNEFSGDSYGLEELQGEPGHYYTRVRLDTTQGTRVFFKGLEQVWTDGLYITGATARVSDGEFYVDVQNGDSIVINVFYYTS